MNTTRKSAIAGSITIALQSLKSSPVRSALTMLGIIIGIAAAIVSVSIAQGAGQQLQEQIESFGTHVLYVWPDSNRRGGRSQGIGTARPITERDLEAIAAIDAIEGISGRVQSSVTVVAGDKNWTTQVQGVDQAFQLVENVELSSGRNFSAREAQSGAKVAILGQTVATELFGDADPIGQRFRVSRTPAEVIGVLEERGATNWGQNQDDVIWMPRPLVATRIAGRQSSFANSVGSLSIKVWDDEDVLETQAEIEYRLRLLRDIQPGAEDDFRVFNFAEFIRARNETELLLGFLLAAFSATSLVVGGIGIMNIMLVSVTERTREIGLRRAVGARRGDVLIQFLVEAIMLGLLGGIIGMLLGVGATYFAAQLGDFPVMISIWTLGGAVVIAIFIALFFGYYPARRAARLDPIEALRFE